MMERQDFNNLRILQELHENNKLNQRALSKKLNISLGLTNAFIKRLVSKGYFKITTLPKSRMKYILTPKGIAEKTRLTYEYFIYSMQYYKMMRKKLRETFVELSRNRVNKIYFFGVSELAEIGFITIQETDIILAGVIDENLIGRDFMGHRVESLMYISDISKKEAVMITKMDSPIKAFKLLIANGIDKNQIIKPTIHEAILKIDVENHP